MSALTTPDAWKEMVQLFESRKQVLDNALVKTLDDQCSASHFQVVRSLMLDQERLLHWFMEHKQPLEQRNLVTSSNPITKSASPLPSANPVAKRAGFFRPGLLTLFGLIFFFVLVLLALLNGRQLPQQPSWGTLDMGARQRDEMHMSHALLAHHLHRHRNVPKIPIPCCIMETNNDPAPENASGSWEKNDAPAPARPAFTDQDGVLACHQTL